ncbi:MAG: bifunctional YncE family protein/alkaline phosphatase family protein [Limisphaerales bacterium]
MIRNRFVHLGSLTAIVLVSFTVCIFAGDFDSTTETVGCSTNGLITPVNQIVTPAGILVELPGMRPQAIALSPDGKLLVTAGLTHELVAADPAGGKILQHVPLPSGKILEQQPVAPVILDADKEAQLSYTGLKFSPDGTRIYLANVNGDVKVFKVSRDHKISPLFSIALPPVNVPGRKEEIPAGIAVARDGKIIYVVLNLSNRLAEIDAATGKVLRLWDVGVAPFDVVLGKNKIYVGNWGGRRPGTNSVTGPVGEDARVRVDAHGVASEGSVTVIDLTETGGASVPASRSLTPTANGSSGASPHQQEILTGRHACALTLSPNGKFLVVANAGDDTLSVIDTRTDKIVETIWARQNPGDLFGAQPNALAFDKSGKKLFVCNGTQNAVAVFQFKPSDSQMLGLIPVGWFPGAIAFDPLHKQICVANIKNIGDKKQKAKQGAIGLGFNTHQYMGSLSLIPIPSKSELEKYTRIALANLRYPLLAQAKLPARPNQLPQPVPERVGEPSVFQHVIYIIKENRTYDQVLGNVNEGNGDADLCIFGERVTPNQHKFVREFALLDNTYCSGILSADGHNWSDSAMATDYLERSFAGWPRSYPAGGSGLSGTDALAFSPAGFIWDDAVAHGKTVADFGEFTTDEKHWRDSARKGKLTFLDCYHDFITGSNAIAYSCEPDIEALRPYMMTNTIGWDLDVPDVWRAAQFIKSLKQFEAADKMPNLSIIWLPNDHTSGTKAGSPTPAAQVADNDLAFGQIVEAVSHSKFWMNTCIFAIEDDPQNGWDHVSGYRTTAYVISPFTKRHAVVSTQYNTTSLLRTMELMLGLLPMNQMDATATPMFDCFTNVPDFTAYDVVTNNVPLDEMNPPIKKLADTQLRQDAYVSARLPLAKADQCPEDVLNRILWRATMGTKPYPEWAVKFADDD